MLKTSTIISGIDTRPAPVRMAIREAMDYGLEYHRKRYMQMHFERYSYNRYSSEYARKNRLANSTQTRQRGRETRRAETRGQSFGLPALDGRGRKNVIPLVHTGLLKSKMLHGGVKYSSRWDKRAITYSPPFYAYASPVGQLDKVRALTALRTDEEQDIAAHVEQKLMQILEQNQQTRGE